MKMRPIVCKWQDGHLVPLPRYARQAAEQFTPAEEYPVEVIEHRSIASHNHYFASIQNIWDNLPDDLAERYPSPEHLRAWALVECGYSNEKNVICTSHSQAIKIAGVMRSLSPMAIIRIKGNVLKVFEAKSQSVHGAHGMRKEEFQQSKTAVLDLLSGMIGLTRAELKKETKVA